MAETKTFAEWEALANSLKPLYSVQMDASGGQHRYLIGDDPTYQPGVTNVLDILGKPALLKWAPKMTALYAVKMFKKLNGKKLSERFWETFLKRAKKQPHITKTMAAQFGTEAHLIFDTYAQFKAVPLSHKTILSSYELFLKEVQPNIIQGDTKLGSKLFGYGGSTDAIIMKDKKIALLDFKSGSAIYETHAYQVGAYSQAMRETYGLDYNPEGYVVRLDKTKTKYEMKKVEDINFCIGAFLKILDLYRTLKVKTFEKKIKR